MIVIVLTLNQVYADINRLNAMSHLILVVFDRTFSSVKGRQQEPTTMKDRKFYRVVEVWGT